MNVLGMGPLELLLILALALIVFGPAKLPEIGAQIGRAVRDFRRTTSELSDEFNRSLKLELEERKADGQVNRGAGTPSAIPAPSPRPDPSSQPAEPPSSSAAPKPGGNDLQPPY